MRQAIVIKNPKWEPFPAASDSFKSLKPNETGVLIVRGRCKEHRPPKVLVKSAKVVASILFVFALALSAFGQANIVGYINGATIAPATTNSTAGNGVLGWNIDQVVVLHAGIVATNTASTAVNVFFDTSDNGTDWKLNAYTFSITPNGTTPANSIQRMTNTIGGKWLRFGKIENENASAITFSRFTMSAKP